MEECGIYEKLRDDLHRFARSIARHEQEANDIVQEAVIKSLKEEKLKHLPVHKQKAWFFRVMKNQLIDERRKEKRTAASVYKSIDIPVQAIASSHLEMVELLSQLAPDLNDLVFKKYWLGMTSSEIAKQKNVPAATIRYKLHIAVKKLRKIVEEDGK